MTIDRRARLLGAVDSIIAEAQSPMLEGEAGLALVTNRYINKTNKTDVDSLDYLFDMMEVTRAYSLDKSRSSIERDFFFKFNREVRSSIIFIIGPTK